MRDLDIFMDRIEQGEAEITDRQASVNEQSIHMMEGFGFHWPYITLKAFDKHESVTSQFIFNAKYPDQVVNVELNAKILRIVKSYITETYDLYLLAELQDTYQILHIDLDKFKNQAKKED